MSAMRQGSALIRQKEFAAAERTYWKAYHPLLLGDRSTDLRNHFLNEGTGVVLKAQDMARELLIAMGELYEDTGRHLEAACCYRKAIPPDIYDAYAWEKHFKVTSEHNLADTEDDWLTLLEKAGLHTEPKPEILPPPITQQGTPVPRAA